MANVFILEFHAMKIKHKISIKKYEIKYLNLLEIINLYFIIILMIIIIIFLLKIYWKIIFLKIMWMDNTLEISNMLQYANLYNLLIVLLIKAFIEYNVYNIFTDDEYNIENYKNQLKEKIIEFDNA